MAVNEIVYNGQTLISLLADTITEDTLTVGFTAHDKSGKKITGQNPYAKAKTLAQVEAQYSTLQQIISKLGIDAPVGDISGDLSASAELIDYILDYANSVSVETWVFTMSNGTTVEKEVHVE